MVHASLKLASQIKYIKQKHSCSVQGTTANEGRGNFRTGTLEPHMNVPGMRYHSYMDNLVKSVGPQCAEMGKRKFNKRCLKL